jgi:hypothetical protein
MEVGDQLHALAALPEGKPPRTPSKGSCLDLGAGLNRYGKFHRYRRSNPDLPARSECRKVRYVTGIFYVPVDST